MAFKPAVLAALATLLLLTLTVTTVPAAAAPAAAAPAEYPSDAAAARAVVGVPVPEAAADTAAASRAAVGAANDGAAPADDHDEGADVAAAHTDDPAGLDTVSRRKWRYKCVRYLRRHCYYLHGRLRCFSRWYRKCRWVYE